MKNIKDFKITQIPMWQIVFATTSEPDYEMNRTLLVEEYPKYNDYTIVSGGHCSCYDFDDSTFDATIYSRDELIKLVTGWLVNGDGSERSIAPLILKHIEDE